MKWLYGYRMRLVLIGCVAAIAFCSGKAKADFTFGEPTNLGLNVNSNSGDDGLTISSDGLTLYFGSDRSDAGDWDIWMATRESLEDRWGPAVNLGSIVNGPSSQSYPSLSADGLELFLTSPSWQSQWTEFGGADLWVSRKPSISEDWSVPENLRPVVNTVYHDTEPSISADGLELYFTSDRPGGYSKWNIWVTTRTTKGEAWRKPVNLGPRVNSEDAYTANVSADGLVLFLSSNRPGGYGHDDIWMTRRKTKEHPWEEPVNLGPPINDSGRQWAPRISHDGSTLFFTDWDKGPKYGRFDLWQVPIFLIVDFNSDRIVDAADMDIMVENWHTENTLCDIAPPPFGDGFVDVQDMIVLTEHLFEDYRIITHWKLDEIEGDIARECIGGNDGICHGGPRWMPSGGKIGGALWLDGIDDYVSTPFVLDSVEGSFSVFAWIQGGSPGQVIIAQRDGRGTGGTWLGVDSSEGRLFTGLSDVYFGELESELVITDGQWRQVGLVYDSDWLHRRLYVDGALVAEDTTVVSSVPSGGGLHIGADTTLDTASFFSGLIDDVRIYNKALSKEEIAILSQ